MSNVYEKKILVIGAQGNLGSQIIQEFECTRFKKVVAWTRKECDVEDVIDVERKIHQISPDIVINTVAYNAVDACERDLEQQKKAIMLNVQFVECLARVCYNIGATLIHFSTNYVFSGEEKIYKEYDEVMPINFYGMTKYLGEKAVLTYVDEGLKGIIVRVANLFGPKGMSASSKSSFFDVIDEAVKSGKELKVVDDEVCCFTYTKDVAKEIIRMLEKEEGIGIFHCVNSEPATCFEATRVYFDLLKVSVDVKSVKSNEFSRMARRPKTAILKNTRTIPMRSYKLALEDYIKEYKIRC